MFVDRIAFPPVVPPMVADLNVTNATESDTTVEVLVEWRGVDFDVVRLTDSCNAPSCFI